MSRKRGSSTHAKRGDDSVKIPARRASFRKRVALAALLATFVAAALHPRPAQAASAVSCGGAAMLGGAQLNCSHVDPHAPTQFCTFSWTLVDSANVGRVVEGSFLLPPGAANAAVYQGSGFTAALSPPTVLCQGRKSRG